MGNCDILNIINRDPQSVQGYQNYVANKLANTSDAFMFFRSFAACFYCVLDHDTTWNSPTFHKIRQFEGWCVGDAHPGNFGVLPLYPTSGDKKLVFTANDADDGTHGLPVYDILRLLTGIHYLDVPYNPNDLICAYLSGLSSGKFPNKKSEIKDFLTNCKVDDPANPNNPYNLLCDVTTNCFTCNNDFGKISNSNKLIPKTTGGSPEEDIFIQPTETAAITNFVANDCFLKEYEVRHSLAFMKKTGGSGFLRQFRICLLNPNLANSDPFRHVILDIKPQCNSGVDYPNPTHDVKQIVARVNSALRKERGGELCRFNRAVEIPGLGCGAFSLRARWEGQQSINLPERQNAAGLTVYTMNNPNLLCAEATILGILHRTAMLGNNDVDEYMVAIDSIRANLIALSQTLYNQMVTAYQCCCQVGQNGCECCDAALLQLVWQIRNNATPTPASTPNSNKNCCNT
ncbi:MAG: DUF2252 domain-containing protein [Magnetococcus sp. YQC-9]